MDHRAERIKRVYFQQGTGMSVNRALNLIDYFMALCEVHTHLGVVLMLLVVSKYNLGITIHVSQSKMT